MFQQQRKPVEMEEAPNIANPRGEKLPDYNLKLIKEEGIAAKAFLQHVEVDENFLIKSKQSFFKLFDRDKVPHVGLFMGIQ